MCFKKIKKLLIKALSIGVVLFTLFSPIKALTDNSKILLDLSHSDIMYYDSSGALIRDNGASYNGYTERELTNQITLKVKSILEKNGICVDLTRDFDEAITIEERVAKAKKFGYDAYISLHANSCVNPNTGTGVEGYSNNQYTLTSNILNDLSETFNLNNRGVYSTPYYNRSIPNSTLIELGFINNDKDRDVLINKQDEIANIIATNIINQYKPVKQNSELQTISTNSGSFNILINYN